MKVVHQKVKILRKKMGNQKIKVVKMMKRKMKFHIIKSIKKKIMQVKTEYQAKVRKIVILMG